MSKSKNSDWLVYHCTEPQHLFSLQPELWKERERYYQLVAVVEAGTLEEVYRLTNHIDHDWRENALVRTLATTPPRSTSVGDVLVRDGQAWIVARVGFIPLDD
jgi:hypothetical protein